MFVRLCACACACVRVCVLADFLFEMVELGGNAFQYRCHNYILMQIRWR